MKKNFQRWVGEMIGAESPDEGCALDIGCGDGRYHPFYNSPVVGFDIRRSRKDMVVGVAGALPFKSESFCFATSFQCYYYIEDIDQAVAELYRILKQGACAILSLSSFRYLRREQRLNRQVAQVLSHKEWGKVFERGGFSLCPLDVPARYNGTWAWAENIPARLLSPYHFFKLRKECLSSCSALLLSD
jgi:SAM-dependent methyltransferase